MYNTLIRQPRAGNATANCSLEILIRPLADIPEDKHPAKGSPSLYQMKRIIGPFKEEQLPEPLKSELLAYLEPDDFESGQAVLYFEVKAGTDWWKEKYGDDIDGNRGETRTMYGDLQIDDIEGPRPMPEKLKEAFGKFLTHEDFDWGD